MQSWIWLAAAIAFEVAGTTCMKLSEGLTRPVPAVLIFVFYALAFAALAVALKHIGVGVAYAVWAGAGTALVAVIGVLAFAEPVTPLKAAGIALIVLGVAAVRLAEGA